MNLDGPALDGVFQAFNSYVSLLINALPGSTENEENLEGFSNKIVSMAETESQQVALLANASLLADELLPRAALKLLPLSSNRMEMTPRRASDRQNRFPEQREWKRKLQRLVDRLRDSFCRTHALDIIFTEDGEIRLNAEIYTCMDESMEEPEWFPSPIFQVTGVYFSQYGLNLEHAIPSSLIRCFCHSIHMLYCGILCLSKSFDC